MGKISFVYAARQYRQASRSVQSQRSPCAAYFPVSLSCFLLSDPDAACVQPARPPQPSPLPGA